VKKITNITIALLPPSLVTVSIFTIQFHHDIPDYWNDPVRYLVSGLLLFMLFALVWIVFKVLGSILFRRTAAAKEAGSSGTPSTGRRKKLSLREIWALMKTLAFARQPDGSAVVFPYILMWQGYRLTPEQAESYRASWGEAAEGGRKKHRAAWNLLNLVWAITCGCLLWFVIRPDRWSFLYVAAALAASAGCILVLRALTKRSFEDEFPSATERRPDPNRIRKRILLLMLMPMWGHLGTGLFAPVLLWITVTGMIGITTKLLNGTFDIRGDLLDVVTTVMIAALAGGATYIAAKHIAFRIRNGRCVGMDDFYAL
jgi:hypothetical protein